jgi:SAM-dependent methyltransferase
MTQIDRRYRDIVAHYEDCLAGYGDSHRGVDWPRREDAELRHRVMLGLIPPDAPRPARLLDFGCGAGHLLEFIRSRRVPGIEYHGLDLSERFLSLCRDKFPKIPFYHADVLDDGVILPEFDFVIMNGVFTEKRELSFRRDVGLPPRGTSADLAVRSPRPGPQCDVEASGLGARRLVPPPVRSPDVLPLIGGLAALRGPA